MPDFGAVPLALEWLSGAAASPSVPDFRAVPLALFEWLNGTAATVAINALSTCLVTVIFWPDRVWWMNFLSRMVQCVRSEFKPSAPEKEEALTPFDAHLRLKMDEARLTNHLYCQEGCKVLSAIYMLVCWTQSAMLQRPLVVTLPNLTWLIIFWVGRHNVPRHAKLMFKIVTFGLFVRTAMVARFTVSWFLMQAGARAIQRMMLGISVLDYRYTMYWNVLLSVALCILFHIHSASFVAQDLGANWTSTGASVVHALSEGFLCVLICGLLYAIEALVEKCVRSSVESSEARKALLAARKLLSVLCDAQVHVGAESEIVFCTAALRHLVLSGKRVTDSELLGTRFLQYVAEGDQARFREFIAGGSTSSVSGGEDSPDRSAPEDDQTCGPPASIQICLRNSLGVNIPVEVFHVEFPDINGSPGHLMGIRETGSQLREVLVDAPGMVAFSKDPAEWPQHLDEAVAECPSEAAAMDAEPPPAGEADHHRPLPSDAESAPSEAPSSSSGGSSRSSRSCQSCQVDSSVESVTMSVNMNSRRMRVNYIVFHFSGSSRRCPGLSDWMQAGPFLALAQECQQRANELSYGSGAEGGPDVGPVELAARGEPFICAESSEVVLDESDEHLDTVLLQLNGLSPLTWLPWARHGAARSLRRRQPSRPVETMPVIDESHQFGSGS